jgi:predicted exporter
MTRYLIAPLAANPGLLAPRLREVAAVIDRFGPRIAWLAPLIVVAALAAAWHDPRAVFASDIGDLSPIPTDLLARDQELRLAMGMAESSHILEVRGSDLEAVLEQQERLAPTLEEAVHAGALRDFQMAASILPSASTQRARQAALPTAAVLTARVVEAQQGLPYRDGVFAPFIADVETARRSAVLDASALSGTELGIRFASLVREEAGTAIGTIALNGLTQAAGLQAVIDRSPSENITMIDLKGSANALVNAYRDETLFRSSLALLVIAIILIVALRNWRRVAMVMIPVLGSVLTAAAIPILFGQPLNVFHLVSLLLVVGIGLDYALFFSRPTADPAESLSTRHSLLVCTLSTGTVFAVLSLSRIPVLSSIGSTVAVGTVTAFILSALLAARSHREAT